MQNQKRPGSQPGGYRYANNGTEGSGGYQHQQAPPPGGQVQVQQQQVQAGLRLGGGRAGAGAAVGVGVGLVQGAGPGVQTQQAGAAGPPPQQDNQKHPTPMHQAPLHPGPYIPAQTYSQEHRSLTSAGTPMPIAYAPPPQPQSRHIYGQVRGAPPRALRHSMVVQVPNMSYVPGGQMYSPPVMSPAPNMQFMLPPNVNVQYSQCDGLPLQSTRGPHNHGTTPSAPPTSNFLPPYSTQSIHIMQPYNFFVQPSMRNSQYQTTAVPNATSQAPPSAQQQVMNQTGGVVGAAGSGEGMGVQADTTSRKNQKRSNALPIINPDTGVNVIEQMQKEENARQSGDSSTSHTPQPQSSGETGLQVSAAFAAAVAKVAADEGGPSESNANGPHHEPHHPSGVHHHPQHHHHHPTAVQEPQHPPKPAPQGKPSLEPTKTVVVIEPPIKETPVVSALTNSPPVDVHHRGVQQGVQPQPPNKRHQSPPSSSSSTSSLSSLGGNKPIQQQRPTTPSHAEPPKKQEKKEEKKVVQKEEPAPQPTVVSVPTPAPVCVPAPAPVQTPVPVPTPAPVPKPPKSSSFADSLNLKNLVVGAPGSLNLHSQPQQQQQQHHHQQDDKQTNGETSVEPSPPPSLVHHHHETNSGSKASQRPKSKKHQKLKDLNRKGVEKEGSDMDAFTEPVAVTTTTTAASGAAYEKQAQREASPMLQAENKQKEPKEKPEEKEQSPTVEKEVLPTKQEVVEETKATPAPSASSVAAPSGVTTTATAAVGSSGKYVPPSRAAAEAAKQQQQLQQSATVEQPPAVSSVTAHTEPEVNDRYEETENSVEDKEIAAGPEEEEEEDGELSADDSSATAAAAVVAAKNQENAKLSGASQPQPEVIETQIIERSMSGDPAAPPTALQLKYEYKNGQWSPLNPEGKKMYDRDLLMAIRNDPLSIKKPEITLDCEIFVKDRDVSNNNTSIRRNAYSSSYSNSGSMSMGGNSNFAPNFMRSTPSQRGMPKRNSQQGRPSQMRGKGMHMTNSLKDEVKLRESENAWKPGRFTNTADSTEEQIKTDALYKKVRGILNKLTPQKFDTLVQQFQQLDIDSYDRLSGVMDLVFEKAVDEPSFSKAYADMCKILTRLQVPQKPVAEPNQEQQMVNFRKLLISRCQCEFEKNKVAELDVERRMAEIKATKAVEKRKELQLLFEEEERKIRVRSVGLVRFIGELFKLSMLTTNIMHNCVKTLIAKIDEESLECLCKLLMTIGKDLEKQSHSEPKLEKDWNGYFDRMARLSVKREDSKVSSRVRFMLQDVLELRANKWVPRRDENNPKTIDQIQKDAERETLEKAAMLASAPLRNQPRDDRRRNIRGSGNTQSEEGWQSVQGKGYRSSNYPIEVGKLQQMKNTDNENVLGSANQFREWGTGAGVKRESHVKSFTDNNSYALLAAQEDRKSQSLMNSRGPNKGAPPSPSLEKERAIQGLKDVGLDSSKNLRGMNSTSSGGGGGRGSTSGPPSRDSSRARYGQMPSRPSASSLAAPSPSPAPPPPVVSTPSIEAKLMSEDEADRKAKTLLEEFRSLKNVNETVQSCKETFPGENINLFLNKALNYVLDMAQSARLSCADLIGHLAVNNIIQSQNIVKEFAKIFASAEDLVIDMPHIWKYIAELLVPILGHEVLNFTDFKTMSQDLPDKSRLYTLLREIFEMLSADKGPAFVRTMWNTSSVQLRDFIAEDKIDAFTKIPKVSQILNEQGGAVSSEPSSTLSLADIEQKLYHFLTSDNDRVFDQICDWTNNTLGNRTKDATFIRALTRAVIKASINNKKLNAATFEKHEKLIKRFVDTKEELELACLYGIQNLVVVEMEAPQGLLHSIFQSLYDNSIISCDAFTKWKSRDNEETVYETEGKGVAVKMLATFLVSLSEMEGDDDVS